MPHPTYTRLYAVADRLLTDYGQPGNIVTDGAPTGPPHNPQPGAETRTPCMFVEGDNSIQNRPGTVVSQGDVFGYIAPSVAVEPTMARRIEAAGGVEMNFVEIKPLNPGGVRLLYEFHARGP
jgi:hypothetical protein